MSKKPSQHCNNLGRLYTENASGLCNYKYKELERAHSVAKKMLLIGPAKDPIFMNDEIGAQNLKGNLSHSNQVNKFNQND